MQVTAYMEPNNPMMKITPPFEWLHDHIQIIDQTCLPEELKLLKITDSESAIQAIKRLAIRGAPALGAFGALAVVVGLDEIKSTNRKDAEARLSELRVAIGDARPTAVNLRWAVDRVIDFGLKSTGGVTEIRESILAEAHRVASEDMAACAAIGLFGAELLNGLEKIGTHCNAGRLATAGIGTALAPFYTKKKAGKPISAFAAETRPLLQGARLTAWELQEAGINVTVVPDGAMASIILSNQLDAFIVGADRIASNGDSANKIGTVSHALAAKEAGIPFYVAAPTSTIDFSIETGSEIEIEQRSPTEVHAINGQRFTPLGVSALNPAFDVTPSRLITAIITEVGVLLPPYKDSITDAINLARRQK